jgi:hypothetical protein
MDTYFKRAIMNISKYGDTDIFPFPTENHIFFDKPAECVSLLLDIYQHFSERLAQFPPSNISALAPVSYTGFRWATQIDPLWNAFFLGTVLSIGNEIEKTRLPKEDEIVFSYRFSQDHENVELFDQNYNWRRFMQKSLQLAAENKFVVTCDISEFYPRLNHHRLENALLQLKLSGDQPSKIMKFLNNFSGTYSFGLPIGGPAARILSELLLNQIDRLLRAEGIKFCRFADDFHLFADSYESAFNALLYLSERLLNNQGLQLQKAKTRIMSGQEFISTSPLGVDSDDAPAEDTNPQPQDQSQNLMRLSVRFDPYSPTASDDYETLKLELQKIDILSLLKAELTKSRIHISLSKKIVSAIRFLDEPQRSEAVLSLIENENLLYPIYANVLFTTKSLYEELREDIQKKIVSYIRSLMKDRSHVLQTELNLSYAVRLLACSDGGPENEESLNKVYDSSRSVLIRRDILLAMAKWKAAYWLSDRRSHFRTFTPGERRAFLISSFCLSDEGRHWRRHIGPELSPFEKIVSDWASEKTQTPNWSIPL